MVGKACLPSNAYYLRTPNYTLYSGVHVCWSEHSDSSFIYGFMSLDYGLGIKTATTFSYFCSTSHPDVSYQVSSQLAQGCRRSRLLKQLLTQHDGQYPTDDGH